MFGLMGHVRAEVAADDAVPRRVVLFVELLLDEGSNVLLDVELLESLGGDINRVLLHIFRHVCVLHNGFAVCHNWFECFLL